jgi:hypothetical protein
MFAWLKVRYCRARLAAYLNHELPPHARRRVARYIEEEPACYAEYIRQRDLQRELIDHMAYFGQSQNEQLSRMWTAIQMELSPAARPRPVIQSPRTRYGLAGMAAAFLIAVPVSLGSSGVAFAEPQSLDNTPPRVVLIQTAESGLDSTEIAATPTDEAAPNTPFVQTAEPVASATPPAGPSSRN